MWMRRLQFGVLVASILLCGSPEVLASNDPPNAAASTQAAAKTPAGAGPARTLETIYVTGTHIRAVDIETEHPLTVLSRPELLRTGLTGVADILQSQIVANGPTLNRNVNNGGNGELRVDLRGLGPNRTLVLVNGRRWVSTLDGAVDLTAIPLPMIERIEVLKDGASAIYGSDAIAGVINIITRRDFDGAEFGASAGQNDHGDGLRRDFDFTWGRYLGRWNVAAGIEYGKDDPILASARAISAVPRYGVPVSVSGSMVTPYGYYEPSEPPWYYDGWVRIPGTPGTSPADFRPFEDALDQSFNYAPYTYLQTPQERRALFAQARFAATPNLAFSLDALLNQRKSAQRLAPPPISFSDYAYGGLQQFGVAAENVYNPFGMLVDTVLLRMAGFDDRRYEQTVDTSRLHVGGEGVFMLAGRELEWGVDASRIRADQREFTTPFADNLKLALAVGPSFFDDSGTARCGTPDAVIPDCVPLDVFGDPAAMTPAMLDYIRISEIHRKRGQTLGFSAHVTGPVADLPAGAAQFAAGVEHRRESGFDHPDPMTVGRRENGNGWNAVGPTNGAYTVDEAYLELDLPLFAGRPGVRELGVTLATRYSDYSLFGGSTHSRLGLRWKPVDDLLVRAGYGEGFRAPSVLELFEGRGTFAGLGMLFDPCASVPEYGYTPPPSTLAHCLAQGVPEDVWQPEIASVTYGGNPELEPESSRTWTAGLVFSPAWLPGFSASVDWYRIKLEQAMAYADPQGLIDQCYISGDASTCGPITRDASGGLSNVLALQENLPGGLEVEGWDVGVNWRRDTRAGTFSLRWDNAYIDYWGEIGKPARGAVLADGSLAQGNVAGTWNSVYGRAWRWRSVLVLAWQRNAWSASATARHFSPIVEPCDLTLYWADVLGDPSLYGLCTDPGHTFEGEPDPRNCVPSVTYVDFTLGWAAPWKGRFTLGVRNAFDRDPPVSRDAVNSFFSDYDVPGRFWWLGYRQKL